MSEFEDRLNSILNSPEQMEKIAGLAQSLMGPSQDAQQTSSGKPKQDKAAAQSPDPALLGRIGAVMQSMGGRDDKQALLRSLAPYLSQRRREKLEKAMELARLIHLAEFAFGDLGGGHAEI